MARSALQTSVAVDRARILWARGLRTGALVVVLVVIALQWAPPTGVMSLTIGAAFVGIADSTAPDRDRVIGLLITLSGFMLAAIVGGLIADFPLLRILASATVALVCGYVGVVGPRAALGGTMALVLTTLYAGSPGALDGGVIAAGWLALGGLCYLLVILPGWLLRRAEGVRIVLATAFRGVANAARRSDHTLSTTAIAVLPMVARDRVAAGELRGASQQWATDLADECDQARRGLIALSTEHRDAADRLRLTAGITLAAIGNSLRFQPLQRLVPGRTARMRSAADAAVAAGVPRPLIQAVVDPVQRAATTITDPWPLGRHSERGPMTLWSPAGIRLVLRNHLTIADPFLRHAIRLCVAIAVATGIAELLPDTHGYWVPLTVAWIAKPDLAGTVVRVVMRIGGTVVGLLAAALAAYVLTEGWEFALAVGMSVLLVAAFLYANYTIAVAGITTFVLLLLSLIGEQVSSLLLPRLVDTLVAGVIVMAASLVLPQASGASVNRDLATLARTGAQYSDAVFARSADAMGAPRLAVLRARTVAESAAAAAAQEPTHHDLDPTLALVIMADLRRVSEQLIRWYELGTITDPPPALAARAHQGLVDLADRLDDLSTPSPAWQLPADAEAAELDLLGPIAEAHARLTAVQ